MRQDTITRNGAQSARHGEDIKDVLRLHDLDVLLF
jgi:hypothetical protein